MDILAQPIENVTTVNGQIPQGALFVSVKNIGAQTATFNNNPLPPGAAKSYPFVGKGYLAMLYVTNGTSLEILYIV